MALDATKLVKVAGADQQLFMYYSAADAIATVIASGYFNSVTDNLRKGDVIIVVGAAYTTIDLVFVTSTTGAATVTTLATEGSTAT